MSIKTIISLLTGHGSESDVQLTQQEQEMLAELKKDKNLHIWLYVPATRHCIMLSDDGSFDQEYNVLQFSQDYHRDDVELMREQIIRICEGYTATGHCVVRGFKEKYGEYQYFDTHFSVTGRDEDGKVLSLLGIQYNITERKKREQQTKDTLARYHTVFNTSLIDMLYYDNKGRLKDLNERARLAFNVPNREMVLDGSFLLENNPMYNQIPLEQMKNTRTSTIVDFGDFQEEKYRLDDFQLKGKMYYESTINPIRNDKGELEGIYMAGQDITEMVESYHREQQSVKQLREATRDIEEYIRNINYALQVSDVRLVNYYPKSYALEVSNSVGSAQLRLSQLRCIRLGTPRFHRIISSVLNRMDHRTPYPITQMIEIEIHDKQGRPIWLMFNMVPIINDDGQVDRYFGMCRNVTDLVETEQRLVVETKKAQETELLKQSFLTNMSYELRTPLNTVVGFAELFEAEHEPEDEPFFVEQIKSSSNTLLQLINDVLLLSRLDAGMEEYKKEEVDFELIFSNYCQVDTIAEGSKAEVVVDHPYKSLVVDIDVQHLGMAIERLCKLAAFYAKNGVVKTSYEYRRGELTISVEDNGVGVPPEVIPHFFDRFTRSKAGILYGTGLDLPIIKALTEQMGGSVEMTSELGKGSTVWISVPCEAKNIERRRDNNTNLSELSEL